MNRLEKSLIGIAGAVLAGLMAIHMYTPSPKTSRPTEQELVKIQEVLNKKNQDYSVFEESGRSPGIPLEFIASSFGIFYVQNRLRKIKQLYGREK